MSSRTSTMVSVYEGTNCLGHVLRKPKVGFEAYDRDDKLIGVYPTAPEAANAVTAAAEEGDE
jgi:hypothetical protein